MFADWRVKSPVLSYLKLNCNLPLCLDLKKWPIACYQFTSLALETVASACQSIKCHYFLTKRSYPKKFLASQKANIVPFPRVVKLFVVKIFSLSQMKIILLSLSFCCLFIVECFSPSSTKTELVPNIGSYANNEVTYTSKFKT